jgi:hypothetical protein
LHIKLQRPGEQKLKVFLKAKAEALKKKYLLPSLLGRGSKKLSEKKKKNKEETPAFQGPRLWPNPSS